MYELKVFLYKKQNACLSFSIQQLGSLNSAPAFDFLLMEKR